MTYILVNWKHHDPNEPVLLYSELDESRFEVRKVEIFPDGTCGYADADGGTRGTGLGLVATPELDEITRDPQFEAVVITKDEFDAVWSRVAPERTADKGTR
jgi:hypothetical protein